jgi:AcrR family transcriptional regulator
VAKLEPTDADAIIRPTPKARATRARLIATAAEAFVADGYGATSVRDIAERSSMTSGAIYGHFSNKANLLGEAVRLRLTEDLDQHGGRPYEEKALADWMEHSWRDYRTRRALRALIVEGAAAARIDPDARRLLRGVLKAKFDIWAAQYRDVWQQQRLDPDIDPKAVMTLLFAAEVGMGVLEALDIDLPKPGVLARAVGKLIGGLGPARRARRGT